MFKSVAYLQTFVQKLCIFKLEIKVIKEKVLKIDFQTGIVIYICAVDIGIGKSLRFHNSFFNEKNNTNASRHIYIYQV